MARAGTREALGSGNVLSILNCLMQLRKVCAHPDLFESRPIVSSFALPSLALPVPALVVLDVPHTGDAATVPDAVLVELSADDAAPAPAHGAGGVASRATSNARMAPPTSLLAEPSIQRLLARVHGASATLGADLAARLQSWAPAADATAHAYAVTTLASAPRPGRQRLPLVLSPPSWALITAVRMPLRPSDRILQDVRRPRRYVADGNARSRELGINGSQERMRAVVSCACGLARYLRYTEALTAMVRSCADRAEALAESELRHFVFVIPPVAAAPAQLSVVGTRRPWRDGQWEAVQRPWPWYGEATASVALAAPAGPARTELLPGDAVLHRVRTAMATFFPDKHLLQYDCGKLQELDRLLRHLKDGGHRVLIFSQMTRMLDILEMFMSLHGHRYMRLDGATGPERRQYLVERFNTDNRVFCFILSTRSGGVGLNLTGADTVIFYDSDWNPAMDAQAQDRCHRIGQTRDVHVYRLITEHSVEENILRKANQKRAMDDMVIGDGAFTVDFFRQLDVRELFDDPVTGAPTPRVAAVAPPVAPAAPVDLERAMAAAEDEADVQALRRAERETTTADADEAEFAERVDVAANAAANAAAGPGSAAPGGPAAAPGTAATKLEQQLAERLRPIERLAVRILEALPEATLMTERRMPSRPRAAVGAGPATAPATDTAVAPTVVGPAPLVAAATEAAAAASAVAVGPGSVAV